MGISTRTNWQAWQAPRAERFRRLLMVSALPVLGGLLLLGLYFGGGISAESRLAGDLQRFGLSSFDFKVLQAEFDKE